MCDNINYCGGPSLSKFLDPHSEHIIIAGYFCIIKFDSMVSVV